MADFQTALDSIAAKYNADIYLFNGKINDTNSDKFVNEIHYKEDKRENCVLILTTLGGDPDAGYRMVRTIKSYYKEFILYVYGFCKSTGTLISLAADTIVMSDLGEFGPLDIQLTNGDEVFSNMSGLSYMQGFVNLNKQLYSTFEQNFIELKQFGITTKTAAEIGANLAIGIIEPIAAQIEPSKLGDVQRSMKIAYDYAERICQNTKDMEAVNQLISGYPSHSFVIDCKEMQKLFENNKDKKIEKATEEDCILEKELGSLVRTQDKKGMVFALKTTILNNVAPVANEQDGDLNNQNNENEQQLHAAQ